MRGPRERDGDPQGGNLTYKIAQIKCSNIEFAPMPSPRQLRKWKSSTKETVTNAIAAHAIIVERRLWRAKFATQREFEAEFNVGEWQCAVPWTHKQLCHFVVTGSSLAESSRLQLGPQACAAWRLQLHCLCSLRQTSLAKNSMFSRRLHQFECRVWV